LTIGTSGDAKAVTMISAKPHRMSVTLRIRPPVPKLLWWTVHELDAPELAADESLEAIFTRGHRVGELSREHVPGGNPGRCAVMFGLQGE
jgi:hypothetical protein